MLKYQLIPNNHINNRMVHFSQWFIQLISDKFQPIFSFPDGLGRTDFETARNYLYERML